MTQHPITPTQQPPIGEKNGQMDHKNIALIARTSSTVDNFHRRMLAQIQKAIGRELTEEEKTAYLKGVAYEAMRRSATK